MIIPHVVLWKWSTPGYRTTYTADHVNTMVAMLRRNGVPLDRIVLVTDDSRGVHCRTHPLWTDCGTLQNVSGKHLPSCYRRLKLFDPLTQEALGIPAGERIVSLDLDAVVLKDFLVLCQRPERYVGWQVPGTKHRVVMNGSMWLFTAGDLDWVWHGFDPENSGRKALAAGYMGSDQGYLSHVLMQQNFVGGWTSTRDGVLSYSRDVRKLKLLPKHTRIVFFAGTLKPWDAVVRRQSTWINRYAFIDKTLKESQDAPVA